MIKNFAIFDSSFEDDSIEDDEGNIKVPAGKNILEAVKEKFSRSCGEVFQHSFYGWQFDFETTNGLRAEVLLQCPDKWLLTVNVRAGFFVSKSKKRDGLSGSVNLVDGALSQVHQIPNYRWVTEEEFNTL